MEQNERKLNISTGYGDMFIVDKVAMSARTVSIDLNMYDPKISVDGNWLKIEMIEKQKED